MKNVDHDSQKFSHPASLLLKTFFKLVGIGNYGNIDIC